MMTTNNSTVNDIDYQRNKVINREKAKPGLRGRINAMCATCIYDPFGSTGTWRQQTEECTSYNCPLYDIRPVSENYVKPSISGNLTDQTEDNS